MLKLTKTGIGLLTRQYRSVLKKCWLINLGIFAFLYSKGVEAYTWENLVVYTGAYRSDELMFQHTGSISNYGWKGQYFDFEKWALEVMNGTFDSNTTYSAGTGLSLSGTTFSIDTNYLNNNYYRKDKKSGILGGFEEGKIGNKIGDNFSKFRADNDNFATKNGDFVLKNDNFLTNNDNFVLNNGDFSLKNLSRLGAFSKCEKACPRPSERKGVTANSAFEFNRQNVASTDAGTTLNNRRQFKVVMDNLSQCHADDGDFSLKNLSRLGAFSKCEKACPRPSERFPASLEKNSAFEQYSRSARGTFLFVSQTHKNVLDSLSKLTANDNFHLVNDGIFSNQSTTFDAKVAENVPAAELRCKIVNETSKKFAEMPFCAPTVAGTSIFFRQKNIEVLDNLSKLTANDNFATTTFLRAI